MPGLDAPVARVVAMPHSLPSQIDARLVMVREPDSQRAASFRVLRHRMSAQGDPHVVVVSSAIANEGKTTCAANLAVALSEDARARVLLVEANRRHPSLAEVFGFFPERCFAEQLESHRQKPDDPWTVVGVAQTLHVLAVRSGDPPRPLTNGATFQTSIESLKRSGYDYIIIDTPPVLGSADVNLVEDVADGVLLATWSGLTTSRSLRLAAEQIEPTKILGFALLNG